MLHSSGKIEDFYDTVDDNNGIDHDAPVHTESNNNVIIPCIDIQLTDNTKQLFEQN